MTQKKSLFIELAERRISQILGVYVAAVWLAVEMGEWMSERFDVPSQFSSYVFVIMISFLPLVALLAWGHGRPGRDKWTQKQIIFIPFNIVIAWFAVTTFIKPEVQVQATEIMSLTDVKTGKVVDYEVAKSGMSQKILGLFWENKTGDESLDWLSYGAMWMVAKDLMRNPIISIRTPYESTKVMRTLVGKGFDRGINEPLSLSLDIANDRNSQWLIKGEIRKQNNALTFEASLYDVLTGAVVTTISASYDDWLFALDDVAEQLANVILKRANIPMSIIPERALSEQLSSNLSAIESVINSLNAVYIDNDYVQGVSWLKRALEADDKLAVAYVLMLSYYRGLGDFNLAKEAAENAMKLEYKLSPETILKVQANYYAINSELDKAIKVLENWVKLSPESADALQALGLNYIVIGNRLDDALKVYEKLSEIQESNATSLVKIALIYRLKDDKDSALAALRMYYNSSQDKSPALIEMAATHMQFGELNEAKINFEEASLLNFNNIDAELGLAKIKGLQGLVDEGIADMDRLVLKAENDNDRVKILSEKEILLMFSGRLHEAMNVVEQMSEYSQSFMDPLSQGMMYDSKIAAYFVYLQDKAAAWEVMQNLRSKTKPPFDQILYMIEMDVYDESGDYDKSAEALNKFETYVKQNKMVIYNQFIIAAKAKKARLAGNYEEAIKLHDQAITESKQSFVTLDSLHVLDDLLFQKALTLFETGQYSAAVDSLEDVLQRNPLNGQVMLLKSKALIQQNKTPQAKELINQVKQLWINADAEFKDLQQLIEVENLLNITAD